MKPLIRLLEGGVSLPSRRFRFLAGDDRLILLPRSFRALILCLPFLNLCLPFLNLGLPEETGRHEKRHPEDGSRATRTPAALFRMLELFFLLSAIFLSRPLPQALALLHPGHHGGFLFTAQVPQTPFRFQPAALLPFQG